jgi:hypothetical protein
MPLTIPKNSKFTFKTKRHLSRKLSTRPERWEVTNNELSCYYDAQAQKLFRQTAIGLCRKRGICRNEPSYELMGPRVVIEFAPDVESQRINLFPNVKYL